MQGESAWEMDGEEACRERAALHEARWVVMAWLGVCQSSCVVTGCTMVADIR